MAIQVTVFSNSGVSIGITFNHVAADGKSFNHFMKSWAYIHRSEKGNLTSLSLPYLDRDVIEDPNGLLSTYMKNWWNWEISGSAEEHPVDNVRVSLVLSRSQIEKMKQVVTAQIKNNIDPGAKLLRVLTFVVTCAFMWVYLIMFQESTDQTDGQSHDDTLYHFVPVADCRDRFEFPVPATYFGNCLTFLFLSAKRSELMGKDGILFAAKAIGRKICELEKGPLIGAKNWVTDLIQALEAGRGRVVSVAGSPRLRVYETDFGWGRPKKSEIVHIGDGGFSLAECRDDEGAIEIGTVIDRDKYDTFNVIFQQGLILDF